ncbi:MAG: aspartate kinase [Bacteroidales bacterium]|jgi:aspartokinase|nr:aspartate kinase [Bacteroidales bacterium]
MKTIAKVVSTIILQKPFLAESLAEGIINISSLAREIKPEIEKLLQKPVQNGAIVMALNRFTPRVDIQRAFRMRKIFSKIGDIMIRTNLSSICVCNSGTLVDKQRQIINIVIEQKNVFYTFVQGVFESTMVISSIIVDQCIKIIEEETIVDQTHDLSSITLKLPEGSINQPGVYYFILRNIAWENINIIEVISTSHEFTLVVKHQEVDKTFSAINVILKNLG